MIAFLCLPVCAVPVQAGQLELGTAAGSTGSVAAFCEAPGWCLQCFCTKSCHKKCCKPHKTVVLFVVLEIACLDLFHISYSPISLSLCIFFFFWKRFVSDHYGREPKMYQRLWCFCIHQLFFLYSCLFLTKAKKDDCVKEEKSS